ncbi:MAG TPA: DEAD/DEAH box helicase [Candidatus Acidoferrales bacterium]|nr:DEAD/DEAH box helicase [Candidatus Acidoferrales bacterium]
MKIGFNISIFAELRLDAALRRGIEDFHYSEATPIQRSAIPVALAGRDVFASAPTGSGKTAAFGIPLLQRLLERRAGGTAALVLTPTRELAQQVAQHLAQLAKHTNLRITPIYGGVAMKPQIKAMRRGTDVVVATPGRLIDLMQQGEARLDSIEICVLDEADRMLDMGFLPSVKRIIAKLPADRQTLCFSATLGSAVVGLAREFLHDPVRINLAPPTPVATVTQWVYEVEQHKKTELLVDLLKDGRVFNAIVFTRTKSRAERVAGALTRHSVDVERIHGDRSQAQRSRALEAFKNGRYRVLVATDVASRGIDIADLGHVINYDVPSEPTDYIHRIGRTGRAQKTGDAITFVSRDEAGSFARIEGALGTPLKRSAHDFMEPASARTLTVEPQVRRRSFQRRRRR